MPKSGLAEVIRYIHKVFKSPNACTRSDRELLEEFLTLREEKAFSDLVERHGPMVFAVCRRLLDHSHEAEDAFQATFLVLIRRASSIRRMESIASWLYGVARRIALRSRTQGNLRRGREREATYMRSSQPAQDLTSQELRLALDEEIGSLPEKYRAPVVLCYLESKTHEQAARELGCPKSTLESRLARARELLRRQLERRGITLAVGAVAITLAEMACATTMPALLTINIVKAATLVATGKAVVAGCISTHVFAMAEEALRGMVLAKGKLVVMVLVFGLAVGGAGWAGYAGLAHTGQPAPPPTKAQLPTPKIQEGVPARKEAPVATDRYGDALPDGAVARLGTERFRLETSPNSTVVSPDGKMIAASALFGRVVVMDATTGKELQAFELPRGIRVGPVAFSPDSKILATGSSDSIVRLWDAVSGNVLDQSFRHQNTPQNDRLPEIGITWVAFSPDKKTLATLGADRTIRLWDIATGRQLHELDIPPQADRFSMRLAFSPDGKTVFFSGGSADKRGIIVMWDSASGKEQRRWETASAIVSLAVSPDSMTIATGASDKKITLWDVAAGKELRYVTPGHQAPVVALAFSSDGNMLASGAGYPDFFTIRLWEAASGKELLKISTPNGNSVLAFLEHDRVLLSSGGSNAVHFWDVGTGKPLRQFVGHEGQLADVTFSPDGKMVATAGGNDGSAGLWDAATGNMVAFFNEEGKATANVTTVAFSPDGKVLAAASSDGIIRLWQIGTKKVIRRLKTPPGSVTTAFSPDGKLLASFCKDRIIRVWEEATGKTIQQWPWGNHGTLSSLAFSPTGDTLAAGARVGKGNSPITLRAWDANSGRELYLREQDRRGLITRRVVDKYEPSGVTAFAFSSDGRMLITANLDDTIQLWESATGRERLRIKHPNHVTSIAVSPAGRILASVNDGLSAYRGSEDPANGGSDVIRLWDILTGMEVHQFRGHRHMVKSVAFSTDGKLVSASYDTTGLVWEVQSALKSKQPELAKLSSDELDALWADLSGTDAANAYRAIWKMVAAQRQSVPFLAERLRPVPPISGDRIARLITELDSDVFNVRTQASKELEQLGDLAEPSLSKVLAAKPSLEMRQRVNKLLDALLGKPVSADQVRVLRALEMLEHVATPEIRQVLETLSKGAPGARLTNEAKASLERLKQRDGRKP